MSNQILKITKVYYPLEEAIQKAMHQNFAAMVRDGLSKVDKFEDLSLFEQTVMYNNACWVLTELGENSLPVYPDTEHICLLIPKNEKECDEQEI